MGMLVAQIGVYRVCHWWICMKLKDVILPVKSVSGIVQCLYYNCQAIDSMLLFHLPKCR